MVEINVHRNDGIQKPKYLDVFLLINFIYLKIKLYLYMETLQVDRTKLYTPTAYALKVGESVQLIKLWMKLDKLKKVKINGHTLVYDI